MGICVEGLGKCEVPEYEFFLAARYEKCWPCNICLKLLKRDENDLLGDENESYCRR